MQSPKKLKISELLFTGKDNPRSARYLAQLLNCDRRDISLSIERERRQGAPICASSDPANPGYYLAETAEELQEYCDRLNNRAGEICKTRGELLKAVTKLP